MWLLSKDYLFPEIFVFRQRRERKGAKNQALLSKVEIAPRIAGYFNNHLSHSVIF
jgi:hypothetical protein